MFRCLVGGVRAVLEGSMGAEGRFPFSLLVVAGEGLGEVEGDGGRGLCWWERGGVEGGLSWERSKN